jgi:hypothetical protein
VAGLSTPNPFYLFWSVTKTNKTQERGGGARSKRTDTTYPQRPESIRRFITESLYGIIPNSILEKQK